MQRTYCDHKIIVYSLSERQVTYKKIMHITLLNIQYHSHDNTCLFLFLQKSETFVKKHHNIFIISGSFYNALLQALYIIFPRLIL